MVIFVSRNAPGGCRSPDDLSLPEFPSLELLVPLEIDSLSWFDLFRVEDNSALSGMRYCAHLGFPRD